MSPPSTESFSPKSRHTRLRIKTPVGWEGKSQNDHRSGDMAETRLSSKDKVTSCPREVDGLRITPTAAVGLQSTHKGGDRKAGETINHEKTSA